MRQQPLDLLIRRWVVIISITTGISLFYAFLIAMAVGRWALGLSVDDSLLYIGGPMFVACVCFFGPRAGKVMGV